MYKYIVIEDVWYKYGSLIHALVIKITIELNIKHHCLTNILNKLNIHIDKGNSSYLFLCKTE